MTNSSINSSSSNSSSRGTRRSNRMRRQNRRMMWCDVKWRDIMTVLMNGNTETNMS